MKENIARFVCDECKETSEPTGDKFPYDAGWIYLYSINGKKELNKRIVEKDKHFCSLECELEYIRKLFLNEKGPKNSPKPKMVIKKPKNGVRNPGLWPKKTKPKAKKKIKKSTPWKETAKVAISDKSPSNHIGRKPKITKDIGNFIKENAAASNKQLSNDIEKKFSVKISDPTIWKYKKDNNLLSKKKVQQKKTKIKRAEDDSDGINFDRLCEAITEKLLVISEDGRKFTIKDLESYGITENTTELWSQLANNGSRLRKKIDKQFGKHIKFFEVGTNDGSVLYIQGN